MQCGRTLWRECETSCAEHLYLAILLVARVADPADIGTRAVTGEPGYQTLCVHVNFLGALRAHTLHWSGDG